MNIVFAHDHKFKKIENNYYSTGGLSDSVLQRYTDIFGSINVLARVIESKEKKEKLSLITNKKVNIIKSDWKGANKYCIEEYILKSDLVIVRLPSFIGNLAIDMAKKHNKPYLIEMVGCPWDAFWNHSIKGKIVAPFMYLKTKKYVKNAKFVLYVTNNFLQKRYPTKGKEISCSDVQLQKIDNEILCKRKNKIINHKAENKIILGTIAAVDVKYKGQEYVIKAISKLNEEMYDFEYWLVGGGDEFYLKSIAKRYGVLDKIKFLGTLSHDKIFDYLDNIDIYIQPSKQEGLPRALVEAISRGCPAVGSLTGGIPELVSDEFIFNKGSVEEIYLMLKKMNKEKMLKEAEKSFEKARTYDKYLLDIKRKNFYEKFFEEYKFRKESE